MNNNVYYLNTMQVLNGHPEIFKVLKSIGPPTPASVHAELVQNV